MLVTLKEQMVDSSFLAVLKVFRSLITLKERQMTFIMNHDFPLFPKWIPIEIQGSRDNVTYFLIYWCILQFTKQQIKKLQKKTPEKPQTSTSLDPVPLNDYQLSFETS